MEKHLEFDSSVVIVQLAGAMNVDYNDDDLDESEVPDSIPVRFYPRDHVPVTFHFKSSGYERMFYGVLWGAFERYYELTVHEIKYLARCHDMVVDRVEDETPSNNGRQVYFSKHIQISEIFLEDETCEDTAH